MTMSESVRVCLREKYVTFSGRASRSEYWWFFAAYFLVLAVLGGIGFALSMGQLDRGMDPTAASLILWGLAGLVMLATLLPMIAVTVRRFHDVNLSGWWYLASVLVGMIPMIGWLASIAAIVICVWRGTKGPNKFGSDPLSPETSAEVFA